MSYILDQVTMRYPQHISHAAVTVFNKNNTHLTSDVKVVVLQLWKQFKELYQCTKTYTTRT